MNENADSHILIENNTCDNSDGVGIGVHGVADGNAAGLVTISNNIISSACTGLSLVGGWMYPVVRNTGYYSNGQNKSSDFSETDPVEVNECPYVLLSRHLKQDCPFIDAGRGYVEETPMIGMTTDYYNSLPDSNKVDLGFHHPNWGYANTGNGSTLNADYNGNGIVNFRDFAILANGWRQSYDINDLSTMTDEWLAVISGHPAISISVSGDVNSLNGEAGVSVAGCSYSTAQVFIFMDGQLMGETDYRENEGEPGVTINTPSYRNGGHLLKGVIIDYNGLITLSEQCDVNFNNPVHCLSISDTYEPNHPLRLLGISATENNLMVKLAKWDEELIWSQETSGDLDVTIPGDVIAGQIYDLSIEQEIGRMLMLDSSWEPVWERAIAARYDLNESYKFAIFLPTAWSYFPVPEDAAKSRKKAVAGIINGCETMGIKYIVLYKDQCTWGNFARVMAGPRASSIINVYLVSRGTFKLPGATAQRTYFELTGGHKVVSYLDPAEPLGGGWDDDAKVHSIASLGLGDTDQLKLVWIDICFNGLYSDMASAWMNMDDIPILDKLYVSWNSTINTSNESCFCDWTAFFFGYPDPDNGFGLYGANTYFQAFTRAQIEVENGTWVSGKCGNYGDTDVRFTGNRYDFK